MILARVSYRTELMAERSLVTVGQCLCLQFRGPSYYCAVERLCHQCTVVQLKISNFHFHTVDTRPHLFAERNWLLRFAIILLCAPDISLQLEVTHTLRIEQHQVLQVKYSMSLHHRTVPITFCQSQQCDETPLFLKILK